MIWSEFNAWEDFLKKQLTIDNCYILAYHECDPAPVDLYAQEQERANGMILISKDNELLWKPLFFGQKRRRFFKDGTYRRYIE